VNDGALGALLSTALILGAMAAVVVVFRVLIRRPAGVSDHDPPGLRTVVAFTGQDPGFTADDDPSRPFVGVRLFRMLCDDLAGRQIDVQNRGTIQYAQRAECVLSQQRFALVLEWLEEHWLLSVDWTPRTAAERRHLALTHQVLSPSDSPELRRLLSTLDGWLKSHPAIANIRWYRKEDWIAEDTTDPSPVPMET
jgi:hypothetical protein